MNKLLALFSIMVLITMGSCEKEKIVNPVDQKTMIGQIFNVAMTGYMQAIAGRSEILVNEQVDYTFMNPDGGYIHVTGDVTGTWNMDDETYTCLGGSLSWGMSESIVNYVIVSDGNNYTCNGDPYISSTATFTYSPGCTTFGTASAIQIGGGFRVVGTDYDYTTNMMLTINLNSSGTGGNVSGTYDGESVYYTF